MKITLTMRNEIGRVKNLYPWRIFHGAIGSDREGGRLSSRRIRGLKTKLEMNGAFRVTLAKNVCPPVNLDAQSS